MAEFFIVNLEAKDFNFEGISFKRLEGYEEGMKKRGYFEHVLSFHAMADDDLTIAPIIREGDLLTVIDDLCFLLSLAQSRHIACPEYELKGRKTWRSYVLGKPRGSKIIDEYKIEPYLETAVKTLRRSDWKSETGFIPAIYFIIERNLDEAMEFEFISAWIALEILANAYAEEHGISRILPSRKFKTVQKTLISALSEIRESDLSAEQRRLVTAKLSDLNRLPVRSLITGFRDKYRLDFVTDKLLDEYIKVRNHLMHTGTYGKIERHRVGELSIRLKASVQLALMTLLGCKDYVGDFLGWKVWITGST